MAHVNDGRVQNAGRHLQPTRRVRRSRWTAFQDALFAHKLLASSVIALLLVASVVGAAVLWRQDVAITNAAQDSKVKFLNGGGGLTGFATLSVGTSGTSATVSLTGVAGVASFQVTDMLRIQNSDGAQSYSVTLSRSTAPNGAITSLLFTVLDGATTIRTFDAASASSAAAFTLPPSKTYDVRIDMLIADGTAAGSLGSMDLRFAISPV